MNTIPIPQRTANRSGFVLLAVLVFVLLLSMLVVSLLFRSRADETAAHASGGSEQAWAAAMSGVQAAIRMGSLAVPGSLEWQDNPAVFRDQPVLDDGVDQWFFTVYSPTGSGETVERRFGLSDESAQINLNHPGAADLTHIPRMTPAMAQVLKQYTGIQTRPVSAGSAQDGSVAPAEPSTTGSTYPIEQPDSSTRPDLSAPLVNSIQATSDPLLGTVLPHGPLISAEEILQIPGFSRSLWFGEDANLNGHLDPNEDDGDEQYPSDNHDGRLDHGMRQYFTIHSWDPELNSAGKPRIDLNDPKAELPASGLPPSFTNFVAALRGAKMKLNHPAALLGAVIHIKDAAGGDVEVASGILPEHLPVVLDLFTTSLDDRHDGRVNLNTASAAVLATLPGVDLPLAETIVSTRTGLSPERRSTVAWLVQETVMDIDRFKALAPSLTTSASQFHFFVLGYGIPSGRYCVVEASIDVAGREPQITYLRDLTRLGLPFRPGGSGTNAPTGVTERSGNSGNGRQLAPFSTHSQHG